MEYVEEMTLGDLGKFAGEMKDKVLANQYARIPLTDREIYVPKVALIAAKIILPIATGVVALEFSDCDVAGASPGDYGWEQNGGTYHTKYYPVGEGPGTIKYYPVEEVSESCHCEQSPLGLEVAVAGLIGAAAAKSQKFRDYVRKLL